MHDFEGERDYERYGLSLNLYWPTRQLVPFGRVYGIGIFGFAMALE